MNSQKENRLKCFDYSSNGAYFITICTKDRKCILGQIVGDRLPVQKLSVLGKIVDDLINEIPNKYNNATVDKYIIMPNHIHIIITLSNNYGTGNPSRTVSNIMGCFKYTAVKKILICILIQLASKFFSGHIMIISFAMRMIIRIFGNT